MKAIILAGGIGKRMFPIQKDKPLLKFLGKELILHQIERLKAAGIDDFTIVCNPRSVQKIKSLVGEQAEYVLQREAKGMADALLSISCPPKEALIVSANDIVEPQAYKAVLEKGGDSVILGYEVKKYFPGGYLITEGDRIKGIIEKPGEGKEPSNLVNIVVHLHRQFDKLVKKLSTVHSARDDVYERAMDEMMREGYDFRFARYSGAWIAIKYPWHILHACEYFLQKAKPYISPEAEISEKAVVESGVIIDARARVLENAVVRAPCYIGEDSIIGNNVLVCGGSHIGRGCVVGFGSEIKHSYIGDNVWLHHNYIGDSVIMDNCSLGDGTITANLRFDSKPIKVNIRGERISTGLTKFGCIMGENCKTGIHSSLMPGVKIGPNSIIGPCALVTQDVDAETALFVKQTLLKKR